MAPPKALTPTYKSMHKRLRRERGPASNYACAECGRQASHWSYIGGDPNELHGMNREWRCAYSADPAYYVPRYVSCHFRLDGLTEKMQQGYRPRQRPTCQYEGCTKPHDARGWCRLHYQRWMKTGSVELPQGKVN